MANEIPVLSVKKAMDLLDMVIGCDLAGEAAPLSALAQRSAMPTNTVHNLLKTLTACGYIEQRGRGVYAPGVKCRQLGRLGQLQTPALQEAAAEAMRRFARDRGEDCVLAVLVNGERVVAAYAAADQTVQISPAAMEKFPFYEKPTGRMLAAIAPEAEFQQILARHGLPGDQWNGIASETALRKELASLRKQGWCQAGDKGGGLIALACPVFGPDAAAWGALGTFAPAYRCPPARRRQLLAALRALADELSTIIPGRADGATSKKGS